MEKINLSSLSENVGSVSYFCENCHIQVFTRDEFEIHLFGVCRTGVFEVAHLTSLEYFGKEDKDNFVLLH